MLASIDEAGTAGVGGGPLWPKPGPGPRVSYADGGPLGVTRSSIRTAAGPHIRSFPPSVRDFPVRPPPAAPRPKSVHSQPGLPPAPAPEEGRAAVAEGGDAGGTRRARSRFLVAQ